MTFDPNTDEHLEWALKLTYMYVIGGHDIAESEVEDAMCDALCNLIGADEFCKWVEGGAGNE